MRISDWSSDVCSSDLPAAEKLPSATVAAKTSIDRARSPPPSIFAFISKILRLRWRYSGLDLESIYAFNATERVNHGISSAGIRSEEHTSELQSLMRISYAVFCLKKKT